MSKGIITIATGKKQYIHMAKMLAVSLKLNYPVLPIAVITDSEDTELRSLYDFIISADMTKGNGYIQKLNMYEYSPFDETIFIDVDCMVVKNIDFLWGLFKDEHVSVIGFKQNTGHHFGTSIDNLCKYFKIDDILIFNGGMYYFKKDSIAQSVFEKARQLIYEYEELGFAKVRGTSINEEPLMSIGMSLHNMQPVFDNWKGMHMACGSIGEVDLDVLKGRCMFQKNGFTVKPAVMHYGGTSYNKFYYRREAAKLRLAYFFKVPKRVTSLLVNGFYNPLYILYIFSYRLARTFFKGVPLKFSPLMPYNFYE
ncbi:hypothetical protein ACFSKU_08090 [Pontibacter silvestris]|uniref:Glycosyl transferase n=1 Tax=Pontibacter silvestris TaxID=2305183 RepID=A0ABW4WX74_9BACT|nr:hypothetical protein [Pontibacter silvestris]MCC9137337.1 hypothetical protein [Pontibacter silvestris]